MEKVTKKKPRKGLKKRTWALLLLLIAALAGGGAYYFSRPQVPPLPETEEKRALLDRPEEEIAALTVRPSAGESYTLRRQDGAFHMEGDADMPLRENTLRDMLNVCADLKAEETILDTAQTPANLADFHLDPPEILVTVAYQDGEAAMLLLGAQTPDEIPHRYCMLSGDTVIYSVLSVDGDVFSHERAYSRAFSQPELRSDLIDRVTVTGSVTFDMRFTPSGWIMESPYRYPLNPLRTDGLLNQIESMGFEACLGMEDELKAEDYGLAEPEVAVSLTQAATVVTGETEDGQQVSIPVPETVYTLYLGSETGKSGVYALWNGAVYKASNFVMGFWKELRPDAMLLLKPVNFLVNDLLRVEFSADGKEKGYTVEMVESVAPNNRIETDEYGQVLYDAAVRRAETGESMDAEAFLTWYQELSQLSPAGTLPEGYVPQGDARARIFLQSNSIARELLFYPYDALHAAMTVDGVCRYYVENSALAALAASLP